jgi:hypothetical protein
MSSPSPAPGTWEGDVMGRKLVLDSRRRNGPNLNVDSCDQIVT